MKRSITISGNRIDYELTRKRVKNINLRISSDGVFVSAPRLVPVQTIEAFLHANAAMILRARERAQARRRISTETMDFAEGEWVPYLGRELPLRLREGTKNSAALCGGEIVLTVKDASDAAMCRKTMEKWLREECLRAVTACCEAVYPYFARRGVKFPELRLRKMTSRWGSCQPTKGVVTFNSSLISVPMDCVEYVAVHELAHFLRADHSAEFYAIVAALIPDWRARRERLNEYEP